MGSLKLTINSAPLAGGVGACGLGAAGDGAGEGAAAGAGTVAGIGGGGGAGGLTGIGGDGEGVDVVLRGVSKLKLW